MLRTMVGVGSAIMQCDTIEYAGGLWLVPSWINNPSTRKRTPIRIVRMDKLQHQKQKFAGADYCLNDPIPTDVLDGVATFVAGVQYEVIENPPILIPIPDRGVH